MAAKAATAAPAPETAPKKKPVAVWAYTQKPTRQCRPDGNGDQEERFECVARQLGTPGNEPAVKAVGASPWRLITDTLADRNDEADAAIAEAELLKEVQAINRKRGFADEANWQ